ncbi:DGQHR domain-containing protein [Massilia sp. MB5]|uniref:DNA sulfur modification protein DndB n=1 Tax=Massilia sp. MB5 TaxID=2919578 RepID=UPI001F0DDC17|nr:DNA sulfur modification protein DndB [Massilia sp. MB5]UMR29723.1 DGQHR domain-containing protein [Massilia sp. MB5]
MKFETILPAVRAQIGDWSYYVTTLEFRQVINLVKAPDELHERKGLSDWIQREAIRGHADEIASYILNNAQRFLGSLIIGVYGGQPDWSPVSISATTKDITPAQHDSLGERLGLLYLTGTEKLFAIDGQHRVEGIRQALAADKENTLATESISAIFIGHNPETVEGRIRTRRLFTTVNKKARPVSKAAKIALDEDDGFAIVTRRLIDEYPLFSDENAHVSYKSASGQIPPNDMDAWTTVVGLYELTRDLYGKPGGFDSERPSDLALEEYFLDFQAALDFLIDSTPELRDVFRSRASRAGAYRSDEKNHLLFRPAGQRTFFKAAQLLISRGHSLEKAIESLLKADLYIHKKHWHHLLWDPVAKRMITNKAALAEAQLLTLIGAPPRTKASKARLDTLLKNAV